MILKTSSCKGNGLSDRFECGMLWVRVSFILIQHKCLWITPFQQCTVVVLAPETSFMFLINIFKADNTSTCILLLTMFIKEIYM